MLLDPPSRPGSDRGPVRARLSALHLLLLAGALVHPAVAGPLQGQHVEDPVLPRGALLFQVQGTFTHAPGLFGQGDEGYRPFGTSFFVPVAPEAFPLLEPVQDALREVTGRSDLSLRMGEVRGRFEVNEQLVPFRLGYGLMERVSLGVTVPLVRRRTDTHLLLDGGGANVGMNPGADGTVAFRTESRAALQELRGLVAEACEESGEESQACQEGREVEARIAGFLDLLDSAWGGVDPFPLEGTDAGAALEDRWTSIREDLFAWGTEPPTTIPLATGPLDDQFFQSELVNPVWGSSGFPRETPEAVMMLGDVEAHLAVGLLRLPPEGRRPGLRSAVEATARFATGQVDSLTMVTPVEPPRGYGGGGIRWITDVLLADGLVGVLLTLDWSTFLDQEVVLLAADPARPWDPTTRRVAVSGAPGDRLGLGVIPRWSITPGLSLGGGYERVAASEGRWAAGEATFRAPATTQHRAVAEFRLAGWSSPLVEDLRFPVELTARGLWTVSGAAGTPRERRMEIGARVLRRR